MDRRTEKYWIDINLLSETFSNPGINNRLKFICLKSFISEYSDLLTRSQSDELLSAGQNEIAKNKLH